MKRLVVVLCVGISAAMSSLSAQSNGTRSDSSLDANQQAVSALFDVFKTPMSPGCAVSITRDGATVFSAGYGVADIEHGIAITPRTAFYAASVSKQFTAAAIGLLALRGQLVLDASVRDFVPEVPDYGTPITVRQLLQHTSGLRDFLALQPLAGWPEDMGVTEEDFLALVHRQKGLSFAPGTKHLYSNTGYVLLSLIVRKVSGRSLREFAAQELFAPLGMTNTGFRDNHTAPIPRRATAYDSLASGRFRTRLPGFDVVGDGGLFTTVEDLAKWNPTMLDGALHAPGLSALMLTPGTLITGDTLEYSMGLYRSTYRGVPIVRHGGINGGYRAEFRVIPSARMTTAVLCNNRAAEPYTLANRIMDVYVGDRLAVPTTTTAAAAAPRVLATTTPTRPVNASDLVGNYFSEELDIRWTILPSAPSGIALRRRNLSPISLASRDTTETHFTVLGTTAAVRFERNTVGRVTGFVVDAGDITNIRFVKLQ